MKIFGMFAATVDPVTGQTTVLMNTGVVSSIVRDAVGVWTLTTQSMAESDVIIKADMVGDPNVLGGVIVTVQHVSFTQKKVFAWGGAPLDRSFNLLFVTKY